MDDDALLSHLENLADDANLELTSRQFKKFFNLAKELVVEQDITLEEIQEEFTSIAPDDEDEWTEFIEAISEFIFELVEKNYKPEE
jgi:hypothetical protein